MFFVYYASIRNELDRLISANFKFQLKTKFMSSLITIK